MKKFPHNLLCVLTLSILLASVFNVSAVCDDPNDPSGNEGQPKPKPTPTPAPRIVK